MSCYIGTYCHTCDMCLHAKKDQRTPVGHLQPLAIPQHPWQIVSINFITELPEANGYDAVMVVVDTLGKRAHFIETHTTITASGAVRLYLCKDITVTVLHYIIIPLRTRTITTSSRIHVLYPFYRASSQILSGPTLTVGLQPQPHLEATWTPQGHGIGSRPPVCHRVHVRALSPSGHLHGIVNCVSSANRWSDRMRQSGIGAVHTHLHFGVTG
jgi:hypothetical protein